MARPRVEWRLRAPSLVKCLEPGHVATSIDFTAPGTPLLPSVLIGTDRCHQQRRRRRLGPPVVAHVLGGPINLLSFYFGCVRGTTV